MKKIIGPIILALLAISTEHVWATGRFVPLTDRVNRAEVIVAGKVVNLRSQWDAAKTKIYTDVTLAVSEGIKGDGAVNRSSITFRVPEGRVDDRIYWIEEGPTFAEGEHILVFLHKNKEGMLVVEEEADKGEIGFGDWEDSDRSQGLVSLVRAAIAGQVLPTEGQPVRRSGKILTAAVVDSIQPNNPIGIGPYEYVKIYGSTFGAPGPASQGIQFVRDYQDPNGTKTFYRQTYSGARFPTWQDNLIKFWPNGSLGPAPGGVTQECRA